MSNAVVCYMIIANVWFATDQFWIGLIWILLAILVALGDYYQPSNE